MSHADYLEGLRRKLEERRRMVREADENWMDRYAREGLAKLKNKPRKCKGNLGD